MAVFALLEKLAPHIETEVNLILNSKQEAETLKSKLEKIRDGLQDAERQGVTDMNVKRWLKELEDVMHEMDDALDKWETKNLELQIEQAEYDDDDISDPWKKVRSLFLSLCSCFKHVAGRREITLEMKSLSERLDRILEERGRYSFVPNNNDKSQGFKQDESTSFIDKSEIHGRDFDKDSLVGRLLLSEGEDRNTQVVSVVGIGGIGKTTLAQLVYNDRRVNDRFDLKAWVSVPDPFDALGTAKAILEAVGSSSNNASRLETLGQQIKDFVSGKRFLLVLDNVWSEDRTKWESLKNFLVGMPGSRILVTTRSEITTRIMGATYLQRLRLLSDSDCATILNKIALDGRSEAEHEKLGHIGLEIAKKCNGLPLAARTIGSMLALRSTEQEWRDVLESPLWRYEDEMTDIFRLLKLSYTDLSPMLKRCFLSSVLYSKGSELYANDLIRIWMAQGYISSSVTWDQVQQSKGIQYFKKLSMRSFFQDLKKYGSHEGNLSCKMHDVMHEFASYLSTSENYFIFDGRTTNQLNMPLDSSMGRMRSVCVRFVSQQGLIRDLLSFLKRVRVLRLSDCDLEELPQEVGKLIHLRYLDLRGNPMKELPETVTDLHNLQTLDLRKCRNLSRLPHEIGKLVNLRHLLISGTDLSEFPQGLEKLTGLWTMDEFRATSDSVGCLRNLNQLEGFLVIKVEGLNDAAESKKANLRTKNRIKRLRLVFSYNVSTDVIEAMIPPPQLESLYVEGHRDQLLPSWITNTMSLENLKGLSIHGFDDCSYSLSPLGKLPKLEVVSIYGMNFQTLAISKGSGVCGFPKLRKLQFFSCGFWEEWEDVEEAAAAAADSASIVMPCLKGVVILDCPKLKALPHRLFRVASSLQKLIIVESECLELRYHKQFGADRDKISHISRIDISGRKSDE